MNFLILHLFVKKIPCKEKSLRHSRPENIAIKLSSKMSNYFLQGALNMKSEFGKIKDVGNIKQIQKRNKMKV